MLRYSEASHVHRAIDVRCFGVPQHDKPALFPNPQSKIGNAIIRAFAALRTRRGTYFTFPSFARIIFTVSACAGSSARFFVSFGSDS